MNNRNEYITPTRLRGERGWTDSLIRKFLGEPDKTAKNPHYSRAAGRTRLYNLARVTEIERQSAFQQAQQQVAERQERGRVQAQRQAERFVESVGASAIPDIPRLSPEELIQQAVDHYNRREPRSERHWEHWEPASARSDPIFLDRISVNYLRHQLSNYDADLLECKGHKGVRRARTLIRNRVLDKIARAYPDLADQCEAQRRDFESDEE